MSSIFMRLSLLVTASDLFDPFDAPVSESATLASAMEVITRYRRADAWGSLVLHEGEPVGWTEYYDLWLALKEDDAHNPSLRVADVMIPLRSSRLISADTTALRLATLLTAQPAGELWFVVDGNEIVGTVNYESLFKPEFRLCILALGIELEQQALRLCVDKDADASWDSLSANRQDMARENLKRVQQRRSHSDAILNQIDAATPMAQVLLPCTSFIDKKTIIMKRRLLPTVGNEDLKRVFNDMEHLRNRCAHPDLHDEPFVGDPAQLTETLQACHHVLHAIEEQLLSNAPPEEEPNSG